MLTELKAGGLTTLVSTPYMDEAARCDRIALLQQGRLLRAPETPESVAQGFAGPLVRVRARGERAALLSDLRAVEAVARAEVFGEWVHVTGRSESNAETLAQAAERALAQNGWDDVRAEPADPSVEDVFMALMGTPDQPTEATNA